MKVLSVQFNNYKSFDNVVFKLDWDCSVLVGVNESGKSNLLDYLENIDLPNGHFYSVKKLEKNRNKNLGSNSAPIVKVNLKLNNHDLKKMNMGNFDENKYPFNQVSDLLQAGIITHVDYREIVESKASISFGTKNGEDEFSGIFKLYFCAGEYEGLIDEILEGLDSIASRFDSKPNITELKDRLYFLKQGNPRLLKYADDYIESIVSWAKSNCTNDDCNVNLKLNQLSEYIARIKEVIPTFKRIGNDSLCQSYRLSETDFKDLSAHGSAFLDFVNASGLDIEVFKRASLSTESSERSIAKNEIRDAVKKNIQEPFNSLYSKTGGGEISIEIEIDSAYMNINIGTSEKKLRSYSERSEGLRWFIRAFLGICSDSETICNPVLLMDEPGVHLHVIAQESLRDFLIQNPFGWQVIYSTHSPFMVPSYSLSNVRILEKDSDENTSITSFNDYQSESNIGGNQSITPVLLAMGCSLSGGSILSPFATAVLTEGKTDLWYLHHSLEKNNIFYTCIHGEGASTLPDNVAKLAGFLNRIVVLVDGDKSGENARKEIDGLGLSNVAVLSISEVFGGSKSIIEDLLSSDDKEMLEKNLSGLKDTKTLLAKQFNKKFSTDESAFSQETISNFEKLVKAINEKAESLGA